MGSCVQEAASVLEHCRPRCRGGAQVKTVCKVRRQACELEASCLTGGCICDETVLVQRDYNTLTQSCRSVLHCLCPTPPLLATQTRRADAAHSLRSQALLSHSAFHICTLPSDSALQHRWHTSLPHVLFMLESNSIQFDPPHPFHRSPFLPAFLPPLLFLPLPPSAPSRNPRQCRWVPPVFITPAPGASGEVWSRRAEGAGAGREEGAAAGRGLRAIGDECGAPLPLR